MFIFEIHKFKFDQRPVNSMLNLQFCLFIGSGGEIPTCDWLILRQQTVAGTFELFCFVTPTFGKMEHSTQAFFSRDGRFVNTNSIARRGKEEAVSSLESF